MMQIPDQTILIGIEELTALVRNSSTNKWQVFGKGAVRVLKGAPEKNFSQKDTFDLNIEINEG